MKPFRIYVPRGLGELRDQLGMMMIKSPKFIDGTGYFPEMNIDQVFTELNEGLRVARGELGACRYLQLLDMSDSVRAHFDADPEDKTDDCLKGREIILDMMDLLKPSARKDPYR